MNPPTLHLDKSDSRNLYFESNGERQNMEVAFELGFYVSPHDCPAAITLLANFLKGRDE